MQSAPRMKRRVQVAEDDERRDILRELVSCFNEAIDEDLEEMLKRHCAVDCHYVERYFDSIPHLPIFRSIQGLEHLSAYLKILFLAMPDVLLFIRGQRLNVRIDGTAYIVGRLYLKGTYLFRLLTEQGSNDYKRVKSIRLSNLFIMAENDGDMDVENENEEEEEPASFHQEELSETVGLPSLETVTSTPESSTDISDLITRAGNGVDVKSCCNYRRCRNLWEPVRVHPRKVLIATPQTTFRIDEKKRRPSLLDIDITIVLHLNRQDKVHRVECSNTARVREYIDPDTVV